MLAVKLRRVKDSEFPLITCLSWNIESPNRHRLVLQENETGEIQVRELLGYMLEVK